MKNVLFAAAVTGVLPFAAYAQSNVTLYGVIDEGLQFNSNAKQIVNGVNIGGRTYSLNSTSGLNGARWGLRGSEDLGGDLKSIFTLESGFDLNNGALGQGGTLFGRQAFVGLSSDSLGTLTTGRQYDMVVKFVAPVSTLGYIGGATTTDHPGDMDNFIASTRTNNSIRYVSPTYSGLTFGTQLSLGGQPGNISGGGGYSGGIGYSAGPLNAGIAINYFKNPTGATAGTGFFTGNANGASSLSGVLNSNYATASAFQNAAAGANYTIGPATFGLTYSNVQYGSIAALNGATAHFHILETGLRWRFTPAFFVGVAYDYTKGSNIVSNNANFGNQHFNQFSMLADYFISKRTDVYVTAAFQKASGTSSIGNAAVANIGNIGDAPSDRQALLRFAIRHTF
jgi:predicted porin